MTLKTVLARWAEKVLAKVDNYDTSEGVVDQYGDDFEAFYTEVAHSTGWDKARNEKSITATKAAREYMLLLLENAIEKELESPIF